jgi:hypothetical protein
MNPHAVNQKVEVVRLPSTGTFVGCTNARNGSPNTSDFHAITELAERLLRLETTIATFIDRMASYLDTPQRTAPSNEWFTTIEFAVEVGRAPYTVRTWASTGRVNCKRAAECRGPYAQYRFHISEVERYRREGLLPKKHRSSR